MNHAHVWVIPTGPSPVIGRCKKSHDEREFLNYSEHRWGGMRFHRKASEEALATPLNVWSGEDS